MLPRFLSALIVVALTATSARAQESDPPAVTIGERLFLSEETVKSHVRHLLAKLQARSRAHAVAAGFRRGLIT